MANDAPELNGIAISIAAMVEEWYEGDWKDHLPAHLIERRLARYRSDLCASGQQVRALDVDDLAQIIRVVDGNNTLGAGELAEAILEAMPIPRIVGALTPAPQAEAQVREAAHRILELYDEALRWLLDPGVHDSHPDSREMAELRRIVGAPARRSPSHDG